MRADSPPVRSLRVVCRPSSLGMQTSIKHQVRLGARHLLDRVDAVARLGDDLDLGQRSQEPLQERAKPVRVVDHHDALQVRSFAGHAIRLAQAAKGGHR